MPNYKNKRFEAIPFLMERLSEDLSLLHGKGFSVSNVKRMRQLYVEFPKGAALSHQLSWTHLVELLKMVLLQFSRKD